MKKYVTIIVHVNRLFIEKQSLLIALCTDFVCKRQIHIWTWQAKKELRGHPVSASVNKTEPKGELSSESSVWIIAKQEPKTNPSSSNCVYSCV